MGARGPQAALLRLAETVGHFRQGRRVVGFQEGSHGRVRQVSRVDGIEVVIRDGARGRREGEEVVDRRRHLEGALVAVRSEEHTSELQSLMRISYAVFCLKKKTKKKLLQYRPYDANISLTTERIKKTG